MRAMLGAAIAIAMTGSIAHAETPTTQADARDPEIAVALAVGVPLLGVAVQVRAMVGSEPNIPLLALGSAAIILGPAAGHWYGHHVGTLGLAARTLGTVALVTTALYFDVGDECDGASCNNFHRDRQIQTGLVVGGLTTIAASMVYDAITAHREVGEWNRTHAISIAPTAIAAPTGSSLGIGIGGRF